MRSVIGWEPKRLIDLADYINGYAFKPEDWGKEGLPIIRIEQLKNPDAPADYFDGKLPPSRIIENGDLVFSWSASLFLRVWRHGRAALNQHLFKVIEKEGVDRVFLKAFIEFYLPTLTAASHGSTMQHITRKELERFCAPFPKSKSEQTKIAEILSTVEQAIEQTEELIAKQQRIKTGLMQDLLTRGIDEHGNSRSEKTHAFKDSPLGRIPVEWETCPLGSLVHIQHGYPFIGEFFSDQRNDNVLLTPGNFHVEGGLYFDERNTKYYVGTVPPEFILTNGDVVVVMTDLTKEMAILGRTAILNHPDRILHNQRIGKVCMNRGIKLDSRFLTLLMNSDTFRREIKATAAGTTVRHTSPAKLLTPHVPRISLEEQVRICARLDPISEAVIRSCNALNKGRSLKDGLMQDLLTGKNRVTPLLEPELTQ